MLSGTFGEVMNSEVSPRSSIKPIFIAAQRLTDPKDRRAYLQEACGEDSDLRANVEGLLAALDQAPSSPLDDAVEKLGSAQTGTLDTASVEAIDIASHPMIGPYKLLEPLGEGGMGTVYMAQQKQPVKRKVALKVIKAGMDSKEVLGRFEAERQALAMMDHSNIARIFDGGLTDQGRPYFVMELVRGFAIDEYCDEGTLSLRDRLKLFIDVCRAVQHAHQKGIIHRDLKPSNILITLHDSVPVVKVIDFGIAKALDHELTERTLFTRFGELVGTPVYMSPEQAELSGLDVDTRSDVYSMGVMLYKLLVGVTPFDEQTLKSVGLDEMRRIIREDEPFRPSQQFDTLENRLASTISGRRGIDPRELTLSMRQELDWVVMKALDKDRNRRYESASALADDIERYLNDESVQAYPPSIAYRSRKYAKRNRVLLTTGAIALASMMTATGVSTWYAVDANAARATADRRFEQSEADYARALNAVDMVVDQVGSEEFAKIPGTDAVRDQLLQSAITLFEEIVAAHSNDPLARRRTAYAYYRLQLLYVDMGKTDDGFESGQHAIALFQRLIEDFPDDLELRVNLANSLNHCGWWLPGGGRSERLQFFQKSIAVLEDFQKVEETTQANAKVLLCLSSAYSSVASLILDEDPHRAEFLSVRAVELCGDKPEYLADAYRTLAKVQLKLGRISEAEQSARKSIEFAHKIPRSRQARERIYRSTIDLALILRKLGKTEAAILAKNDAQELAMELNAEYRHRARFEKWVVEGRLRGAKEIDLSLDR